MHFHSEPRLQKRLRKKTGTYNLSDFGMNADANATKRINKDAEKISKNVPKCKAQYLSQLAMQSTTCKTLLVVVFKLSKSLIKMFTDHCSCFSKNGKSCSFWILISDLYKLSSDSGNRLQHMVIDYSSVKNSFPKHGNRLRLMCNRLWQCKK